MERGVQVWIRGFLLPNNDVFWTTLVACRCTYSPIKGKADYQRYPDKLQR